MPFGRTYGVLNGRHPLDFFFGLGLDEDVRRLTSHQAGLYGIPDRDHIAVGAGADL